MSHVDEGTLHALVDNALNATERHAVEVHLASCGECARRFAEATAMARQVVTLLGALDAPASRVRVEPPAAAPSRAVTLATGSVRRGMFTLRRVALAASVLLVAGVSYEVGKNREAPPSFESVPKSARVRGTAAPMRAMPSVVDVAADSFVAAPAPSVRERPRGGPRSEAEIVVSGRGESGASRQAASAGISVTAISDAAVPAAVPVTASGQAASHAPAVSPSQALRAVQSVAPALAAAEVAIDTVASRRAAASRDAEDALNRVQAQERERKGSPPPAGVSRMRPPMELGAVVVTGVSARAAADARSDVSARKASPKVVQLAGYSVMEDSLGAPTTRRRYFSPRGTALELLITPTVAARKESAGKRSAAEFLVTTENGRSVVRWQASGMDYLLEGALTPDSLMKLAIQLKP